MKLCYVALVLLVGYVGSAHAGTYYCDVQFSDGSKTRLRNITADSEAHAKRLAKESNSNIKWIDCARVD